MSQKEIYFRLFKYTFPYARYGVLALLGYVLFAASQPAFAVLMKEFVEALQDDSTRGVYFVPVLAVSIALVRAIGTFLGSYYIAQVGQSVVHDLRCEMFDKLMRLPVSYFDQNKDAHLVSRITFNVNNVANAVTNAVRITVREGFTIIGLLGYMIWVSWQLTLVMLLVVPPAILLIRWVGKAIKKAGIGIQDAMGDVNHSVAEGARGIRLIKSYDAGAVVSQNFVATSKNARKISLKLVRLSSIYTPAMQFSVIITMAIVMYVVLLAKSNYETSTLVAYLTAAALLPKSVRELSSVYTTILMGIIAAESLFSQLDEEDEIDNGTYDPEQVEGDLRIEGVSFTYKGLEQPVLNNVSLHAPPGKTIAIVGRSGSGKTTLVNLIPRFYDPSVGSILLDGVPIQEWRLSALRRNIALVSQQVVLLNDTVASNIAYSTQYHHSIERIIEAAKAANAHDFISNLPNGYDTLIGDDGILLSGGQRQRLSIARAILADCTVLLLDEATAALDNESEMLIQDALDKLMCNKTTVTIAHRLSTIENADLIVVMEDGVIIEQGKRNELMAAGGAFYNLATAGSDELVSDDPMVFKEV